LYKLIAGPGVFICDECVAEAETALRREPARNLAWTPAGKLKCSFCGSATKDGLAGNAATRLCGTCVELCRRILTDEGVGASPV
jgi:ATP-dependent protease Clp ATPase subunit